MLTFWSRYLACHTTSRMLWTHGLIFAAVLLWFQLPWGQPASISAVKNNSHGFGILNVLPYYTTDTAYQHLTAYVPSGQWHVLTILALDAVLLIPAYMNWLGGLLWLAMGSTGQPVSRWRVLVLHLPVVAGVCNLLEDGVMAVLIAVLPQVHADAAAAMAALTLTKTAALWITLGILLTLGLKALIGRLQR